VIAPEIRAVERTARGVRLTLGIPADLSYFQGHFPGCPLLPGVVQVTWAIELARQHIPFTARFRSLGAVKFTRVILPGATVTLQLDYAGDTRELDFTYEIDGRHCSNGSAVFDAPEHAAATDTRSPATAGEG
jgi:3-hydroxymyristoyl/3-hydroxydecanoyl-(acyl carrier protein) dehydratase